jgi:hypothetical protein
LTNDTNTLNGALRELGETMAANLTTQGVASTWDEGLTTLAGKILDITPGPTPSFDGISLTGNKNILSAADSEYVTLEAQLTDDGSAAAVSGETVTFTVYKSSDDSVVTTLTDDTDSSGLATVSYYGNGTGDIYIKSSANSILSDPYSIEDCYLYDDASSNKLSNYTKTSSLTATHDTDHYVFSTSSNNQFVAFSSGHDNVRFEVKVMPKTNLTQNSGVSIGSTSGTFNSCVTCYTRTSNTIAFNKHSGTTYGGIENYSYTWSLDTYYTFFVEVNGSSVKIGVLDSTGTLIRQNTVSMSISNKYLRFVQTNGTVASWVKDIKVKAL